MKDIQGKISVIMPAFNEAGRIAANVEETIATFNNFGCAYELIVIDDGSTDNTFLALEELSKKYPRQLIVRKNPYNLGKGRAIKKALHYLDGDYVVFLDADMDLHPAQVQTLFDIMRLDKADIVIGSKRHPLSRVNYPFLRIIYSRVYQVLVKILFGLNVTDTQVGIKLFKRKVLNKVMPRLVIKAWAFDLEVLVVASHLGFSRIIEAPVKLQMRHFGSKIGFSAIRNILIDTIAIFYRLNFLRYYDRKISQEAKKLHPG